MHALLYDWPCRWCGDRHTLCLDDHAQAWANRDFTYTCPATGEVAVVRTAGWDRVRADRPDGAVALNPAGG